MASILKYLPSQKYSDLTSVSESDEDYLIEDVDRPTRQCTCTRNRRLAMSSVILLFLSIPIIGYLLFRIDHPLVSDKFCAKKLSSWCLCYFLSFLFRIANIY
jgi:hypothetical protein